MKVFVILFLLYYIYIKLNQEQKIKRCKDIFDLISEKDANKYYHILCVLNNLLTSHKILYSMTRATLLGAVRHKGLVPWYENLSVLIFKNDLNRIKQLKDEFLKYEIELHKENLTLKYKDKIIKLFVFKEEEEKFIHAKQELRYTDYYTEDELFPLKRYKFGPLNLRGPDKAIKYLKRTFGEDILVSCKGKNRKLKMASDDYNTITPSDEIRKELHFKCII